MPKPVVVVETPCPGSMVTVAEADLLGSVVLTAVMVMLCADAMVAGAVYRPVLSTEPMPAGLMFQVTWRCRSRRKIVAGRRQRA